MAGAGMCLDDFPFATADDAHDRPGIMTISRQRAIEQFGGPLGGTVYVGDGVWDARACRVLGIPFIGVGRGAGAKRLSEEGAMVVFPDLSDGNSFLKTLDGIAGTV